MPERAPLAWPERAGRRTLPIRLLAVLTLLAAGAAGYEAALVNDAWLLPEREKPEEEVFSRAMGRANRNLVEAAARRSVCSWTQATVAEMWREATSVIEDEPIQQVITEILQPNLTNGLVRAGRLAIDSELTALVLDARAERAAQRRPRFPDRLMTLGVGVCPEARWSYRVNSDGTVRIAFEDRLEASSAPFQLPTEFTAGTARLRLKFVPPLPLVRGR